MKVITSRDFNQDVSQAKRAARIEPVFVTDRGKATHVLMSVEAYRKLTGQAESIVDLLAMATPAVGAAAVGADDIRSDEAWDGRGGLG
jgi:PHD/YefM family antitoxin component YafN of YafNO toxin-antitoxin module